MFGHLKWTGVPVFAIFLSFAVLAQTPTVTGELRVWHAITITFEGPTTSETASPNPFADYRLDVTFTNGGITYVVPGYYAADGNAAESSAQSGNKWQVRFAPDRSGDWNWSADFTSGTDVAVEGGGSSAGFFDGSGGTITVAESNKSGRDHRGKGRLQYVGEHYLRYAATGEWFVKAGADAPENTLAYEDFDEVPNVGGRRKSWGPHAVDYEAAEASAYTWQGGKGSELLGAIAYLSNKGVNAFSFLTFNVLGDGRNVFPHLLRVSADDYGGADAWSNDLYQDRFDVSRMEQWERIFAYGDQKGMYLHFKLQETENDQLMDGGNVGRERKLYYRELVARYGHHLALNWNFGEENTQTDSQRKLMAAFMEGLDPYQHLRVIHTYPGQKNAVYTPLLGSASSYTGASLQTSNGNQQETFTQTLEWVKASAAAGTPWVVAVDEPGNASIGVDADPDDRKLIRHRVVWGNFMAGGGGTEFYYGYQSGCGDLNCQDHRSRDEKYTDAAIALTFFQTHFQPYLPAVDNLNSLTGDDNDYVLGRVGEVYAVYRPDGGSTSIDLPAGTWQVAWYNPRSGVLESPTALSGGVLTAPNNDDWTGLITPGSCTSGQSCNDGDPCTENDILDADCNCSGTAVDDSDGDGVCDAEDACPDLDDRLVGQPCDDGDPDTADDRYRTDCSCQGQPSGSANENWIEAECGGFGSAWEMVNDPLASDGQQLRAVAATTFLNTPPTEEEFRIEYSFQVPTAGTYRVYARTTTSEDGDDSVWIRMNGGDWYDWNRINFPYTDSELVWSQAGDWKGGSTVEPLEFSLEAGTNLFEVAFREPNIVLDKVAVLPVMNEEPSGTGAASDCSVSALPVSWIGAKAERSGQERVEVSWTVTDERQVDYYEIQRSSVTAGTFSSIGYSSALNETGITTYRHTDPAAPAEETLYRIIQYDYDGTSSVGPLATLAELATEVSVFPNPMKDHLTVSGQREIEKLEIHDATGRRTHSLDLAEPVYRLRISTVDWPSGIYWLSWVSRGRQYRRRVVKGLP
jgi:hypothetical protein